MLTKYNLDDLLKSPFEKIKQTNEFGAEYWSARKLAKILGYSEYRHFMPVIEKAKKACVNSKYKIEDHFEDMLDMVVIGSGAKRELSGTMPEELPEHESIKKVEKKKRKELER